MSNHNKPQVFATSTAQHLLDAICRQLDVTPGKYSLSHRGGEIQINLEGSVAGNHVFVIGSTQPPYENTLELAMLVDAAKRSSAREITVIATYLSYTQAVLRKEDKREPIGLPLALAPLKEAGPNRLILLDVSHREAFAFSGFNPTHIYGSLFALPALKAHHEKQPFVVAPLHGGGVERARRIAELIGTDYVPETRYLDSEAVMFVDAVLADPQDLIECAQEAKFKGVKKVSAYFSHTTLSDVFEAERLQSSAAIDEIFITDTVARSCNLLMMRNKFTILKSLPLLVEVVRRVNNGESLSRDVLKRALEAQYTLRAVA